MFLQNLKKEMNMPQDENNYGEQKVFLLMKRIKLLKQKFHNSKYKDIDFSEIVLTNVDLTPTISTTEANTDEDMNYRLPLNEVGTRQKYRRIGEISNTIISESEKQQVTTNELMGIVIQKINYKVNKGAAACGVKLQENCNIEKKLPVSAASYIQLYNNMGRTAYQRQLNTMKIYDINSFPTWKVLRDYQRSITPDIVSIDPNENMGIKTSYKEALTLTIKQILLSLDNLPPPQPLVFHFKDGVDGSGCHSIYNQEGNKHTNNMIMYMFTGLKLITENGSELWSEYSPCSPHATRPLMIFLGKENIENMKIVMNIQKERQNIEQFSVLIEDNLYIILLVGNFTMLDGKMRKCVSGLGGAWCLLCTTNRSEASGFCPENGIERVKSGFPINR